MTQDLLAQQLHDSYAQWERPPLVSEGYWKFLGEYCALLRGYIQNAGAVSQYTTPGVVDALSKYAPYYVESCAIRKARLSTGEADRLLAFLVENRRWQQFVQPAENAYHLVWLFLERLRMSEKLQQLDTHNRIGSILAGWTGDGTWRTTAPTGPNIIDICFGPACCTLLRDEYAEIHDFDHRVWSLRLPFVGALANREPTTPSAALPSDLVL